MDRTAIILAGGRATRFGEPHKALATLDGTPLIRHVAVRVAPVVDELVVSCRHAQEPELRTALAGTKPQLRFAFDPVSDQGPVTGLRTALDAASTPSAFVTGCDRPFVDTRFVELLFELLDTESAVVPVYDGHRQPLTAVYRRSPARRACDAMLTAGTPTLQALIEWLDARILPGHHVERVTDDATFFDINTRSTLAAIEVTR